MGVVVKIWWSSLLVFYSCFAFSQPTRVKGRVVDALDYSPLTGAQIHITDSDVAVFTDKEGFFSLDGDYLPLGNQVLQLSFEGYEDKLYPVLIARHHILDLKIIELTPDMTQGQQEIALIQLSDEELEEDRNSASSISGLLSSSTDIFFKAAAYDFSAAFFNPRGLDNRYGKLLINGIDFNELTTGRPEWGGIGGLNDVMRNQMFFAGTEAGSYDFGGAVATTHTLMRASQYRKGGKISYAQANRTYRGRVMASYGSGMNARGWAYAVLLSRRFGNRGYQEGTPYEASSFFVAAEKKISERQSLNLTAFYTPNKRGKTTAVTQEIQRLKGPHYNPLWGYQEGEIRNSRVKQVKQPVIMLNHYINLSDKTRLNTNLAYRFGTVGNTRIDNGGTQLVYAADGQKAYTGGTQNPLPDYYQNLPTYFLRDPQPDAGDFQKAFLAEKEFVENGQLDWQELYAANKSREQTGGNAVYVIQEDMEDNRQISVNTLFNTAFTDQFKLDAKLAYTRLNQRNYARVNDLLGAKAYLDIDFFADEPNEANGIITDLAQSDMNNPDRLVGKNDKYKYDYSVLADKAQAFAQIKRNTKHLDVYLGLEVSRTSYQREGHYRNGYFPDYSFGKSEKLNFTDLGVKAGLLYKITGQHMLQWNGMYQTRPPVIRHVFTNARQNGIPVTEITSEKIQLTDLSYIYRSPLVKARLTGFYSQIDDAANVGFYFAQGISGMGEKHNAAFIQEITTGIRQQNLGVEYGIEANVVPGITIKAAGSVRQSVYVNNPQLYLTSQDFRKDLLHGTQLDFAEKHQGVPLTFGDGTTKIKNYHVAGGPERVYQFGVEYQDPGYWFIGTTANFFSHAYVDINKLRRTDNFTRDADGLTFNDYDAGLAKELLRQEQLGSYMLVNLVGGKSWRINQYFIGVFGLVSNLLNQPYKSGGFESGRKVNFMNYREDHNAAYGPQFGNRYFLGYGTTFYLNFYVRF